MDTCQRVWHGIGMKAALPVVLLLLLSFSTATVRAQDAPQTAEEFDKQWEASLAAAVKTYPALEDPTSPLSVKAAAIQKQYAQMPEKQAVYEHPSSAMLFAEMAAEALKEEKKLSLAQRVVNLEGELKTQADAAAAKIKDLEAKLAAQTEVAKNQRAHADNLVANTPGFEEIAKVKKERDSWNEIALRWQSRAEKAEKEVAEIDGIAAKWRIEAYKMKDRVIALSTSQQPVRYHNPALNADYGSSTITSPVEFEIRGNNAFGSDGSMLRKRVDSAGNVHYE